MALVLAAGSAVSLASTASAATSTSTATTSTLSDVVPNLLSLVSKGDVADNGLLAAATPITVGVLMPGDAAARNAAYTAMTTKGSASYGKTYTPGELAADFGVDPAVSKAVQTAYEADGLKAVYVAKDSSYLELSGTAADIEKAFSVSLHSYTSGKTTFFANTTGAVVPSGVSNVLGLTDLAKMHTDADQDTCAGVACIGTAGPSALWSLYDQPNNGVNSGDLGQGQKIAIFGEGDLKEVVSDLRTFEGLTTEDTDVSKPVLPQVPVRETLIADPQTDTSGAGEWDLDSQSSTGMSPDLAELDYYFGASLDNADIEGTYSAWVNDASGPAIGNSSFGGCELLDGALGDDEAFDTVLQQATMEGRTMFVSSGDNGSGGCVVDGLGVNGATQGAPSVESPAASPYVVAVGGNVLYSAVDANGDQVQPAARDDEYGWTSSGGGYSDFEARPADQAALGGVLPTTTPCLGDNTGIGSTPSAACRMVPDVSAMSGDIITNQYGIVVAGASTSSGGTSLSSPLWAGMWARVRAAHPVGCTTYSNVSPLSLDGNLGFAQPLLYAVAEAGTTSDQAFYDIGGTTDSTPSTNGAWTTQAKTPTVDPTGYDLVTGLGSPDVTKLAQALDCGNIAPTFVAVAAASLPEASAPVALVGIGFLVAMGGALTLRRRRLA